jgi:hypothetical protein
MLDKTLFQEAMAMFSINFGFELKGEDGRIYKRLVFDALQNEVSDEAFKKATYSILKTTTLEAWNKAYGFKGKPAVADWIEAVISKQEFVKKTQYYQCETTGAMLSRQISLKKENQFLIENEK